MGEPILRVENLKTQFVTEDGVVKAVDGVSFALEASETLGIVGESGSGKSVTALSILRLVSRPGRIVEGRNLLDLTERQMRDVRGNDISMIFQEPMTSLDQLYTVGDQILEAIKLHQG